MNLSIASASEASSQPVELQGTPLPKVRGPVEQPSAEPNSKSKSASLEEVKAAAEQMDKLAKLFNQSLKFSVDDKTGTIVVKVIEDKTGDLIRQIPSEEALQISRSIASTVKGLLLNQSA